MRADANATAKSKSRYKAAAHIENIRVECTRTGESYATLNMENRSGGGNEILHLGKMLNGENTAHKND